MEKLNISPNFTINDIHKIREHNYEMTKNMTFQERKDYYSKGANKALEIMQKLKKQNN